MSKIDAIKTKLHTDPDSIIMWMDDGSLPHCWYDSEEVSCLRINLMLEGDNDVYVILILPGDEEYTYDAWLRRAGSSDIIHMLSKRARHPEDVAVLVKEHLPDYLGLI